MSTYFVTPVCRTIAADDHRHAQQLARSLAPNARAILVQPTGVTVPADSLYDHTHTLDTYF